MGSMDFTNMNMNTGFFSWIISVDISVLLKIYGYEYEYVKFSWILSMGSPSQKSATAKQGSIKECPIFQLCQSKSTVLFNAMPSSIIFIPR
jgi:hypothetical protein